MLRTRQEADEIVDLYGGGSEVMISHPELFSANILHLMPLYECLGPSSDPDKRSGPWESPTEPPDIVTTTFQRGKVCVTSRFFCVCARTALSFTELSLELQADRSLKRGAD